MRSSPLPICPLHFLHLDLPLEAFSSLNVVDILGSCCGSCCVVWDSFIFVRCDDGTSKCKICEKSRGAEFLNRSSSLVESTSQPVILRCCR